MQQNSTDESKLRIRPKAQHVSSFHHLPLYMLSPDWLKILRLMIYRGPMLQFQTFNSLSLF